MQPDATVTISPPEGSSPPAASFMLPLRVYYEDTDAGGVVYYANYLRFCERARTELLRQCGVAQQELIDEEGIGFVVRSLSADYLLPARLDDLLEVHTRIHALRRVSVAFEQEIRRGHELLFSATVLVACINLRQQKPVAIPPPVHALLEKLK